MTTVGVPASVGAWRPTAAHLRAVALGLTGAVLGALLRRPDLVVLASPLLVTALWAIWRRPSRPAVLRTAVRPDSVREGGRTEVAATVTVDETAETVALALPLHPLVEYEPESACGVVAAAPGPVTMAVDCRVMRWGRTTLGPAVVTATSSFGSYRAQWLEQRPLVVTALPVPDAFDVAAPLPHPVGLVGHNRSTRPGEGTELADIRPFRLGDRIRRVHWPVSLRTGQLHVTTTYADQDAEVHILVDAVTDVGPSEGVGGRSSSLDHAVRAAGAIAEHFLARGERVALTVVGSRTSPTVRPSSGRRHLRRILDVLAGVRPDDGTIAAARDVERRLHQEPVSAGAIVLVLTPMTSPEVLSYAVSLSRRGFAVAVVDTLPDELTTPSPGGDTSASWVPVPASGQTSTPVAQVSGRFGRATDEQRRRALLAWRLRLIERQREVRRARALGLAITPWRGPRSLDAVLQVLGRRARAPRVALR